MSPAVTVPNFTPRPYQLACMAARDRGIQFIVWCMHRRGGKDLTWLHQEHKEMWQRVGAYWHVFPTAAWGRKAIWTEFTRDGQRIMEQVFPREVRKYPRDWTPNGEMVVELKNGAVWRLMGSDNMAFVGAGPMGVTFSEFAQAKPSAWDLVRPMLAERNGWAAFISTPRGNNHFKKLYDMAGKTPGWWRELLTVHDTGGYLDKTPDELLASERASGMEEALVRQEYLCDWTAASVGSIFGDLVGQLEAQGLVTDFEHPNDGVLTSWDLGVSDATAIWFFRLGSSAAAPLDVVDYYEAHGKPFSHYRDVVNDRGYHYLQHWLPHDARARHLTGMTVREAAEEAWPAKVSIVPRVEQKADGIQAGRWVLEQGPRFHATKCARGIEALKQYSYAYDEDTKTFARTPQHDWSSHGADAWEGLGTVAKVSEMLRPRVKPPPKSPAVPVSGSFRLDELFEAHGR
jgi:hypothetical protein